MLISHPVWTRGQWTERPHGAVVSEATGGVLGEVENACGGYTGDERTGGRFPRPRETKTSRGSTGLGALIYPSIQKVFRA
jgi:hypothetical protein